MQTIIMEVYNNIAASFDKTRRAKWKGVTEFINSLQSKSMILDMGCGNGKYLDSRKDCYFIALDACANLVDIAQYNHPTTTDFAIGNGLNLPFTNDKFDAVISIAVLHHLTTKELRSRFIQEALRVLVPGGKLYVTVWAVDCQMKNKDKWIKLSTDNDYLVPWKTNGHTFHRFYHLYSEDEVKDISSTYKYEDGNYHIEITRV